MANPKRDVPLKLDGSTYKLRFDLNALARMEEEGFINTGEEADEAAATDLSFSQMRTMIHIGLQANHPDLSEEDVGALVGAWNMEDLAGKLEEAQQVASSGEEGGEGNG